MARTETSRSPTAVHVLASQVLANTKVSLRVTELADTKDSLRVTAMQVAKNPTVSLRISELRDLAGNPTVSIRISELQDVKVMSRAAGSAPPGILRFH